QTIRQVKATIQVHHGYQAMHQRLFVDGVQLEDDHAVASYPALQAGSELCLVMRQSQLSPNQTPNSLPAFLADALRFKADRILACLVSGRATALLDKYLDSR